MSDPVRVIVADDHTLVREWIRHTLERAGDIEVVGEASGGAEAVAMVEGLAPEVAILDIKMPGLNGIEATRRIKASTPEVGVLILSAYADDQYVFAVLEAGAAGYVLKDVTGDQLVEAVRAIRTGESVLHPAIARKVLSRFVAAEGPDPETDRRPLTGRELEVLREAAAGRSNQQIAARLGLSVRTVEVHLSHVFSKLGVASRTEAVIHGLRRGWLSLEGDQG